MRQLASARALGPAIAAFLGVGAVIWFVGAPLWWDVTIGLVAAVIVLLWRATPPLEDPMWPKLPLEKSPGSRDDVHVLGWAVANLRGRVQPRALERVRAVARDRLAQLGLDLDAASNRTQITQLIGRHAYATLHSSVSSMPSQAALLACLDALDRAKP